MLHQCNEGSDEKKLPKTVKIMNLSKPQDFHTLLQIFTPPSLQLITDDTSFTFTFEGSLSMITMKKESPIVAGSQGDLDERLYT